MKRLLIVAVSISLILCGGYASARWIETRFDRIPDYAHLPGYPVVESAQDGLWSDPATWNSGLVPDENTIAKIKHNVVLASTQAAEVVSVQPDGALVFARHGLVKLTVTTLQVIGGTLDMGTSADPIQGFVEVALRGKPLNTQFDPEQYGHGIVVINGTWTAHGRSKTAFVRLGEPIKAGDVRLELSHPVEGWNVGDEVVVPDTRQGRIKDRKDPLSAQWERRTISTVGDTWVEVSKPFDFDHGGAKDRDGALRYLGHVGNLSRNISVYPTDPTTYRSHIMFTGRSVVDVRYARFHSLGRTSIEAIDNTEFDDNGNVVRVGTNQIGRYMIHAHHVVSPTLVDDGCTFVLQGLALDGGEEVHKWRWHMGLHDSSFGCVRNNVVYNAAGTGIGSEDGNEQNVIEQNFVVRVSGTGLRADRGCGQDCANEGTGIWSRGPLNLIRNNVVANSPDRSCYTFFLKRRGTIRVQTQALMDPYEPGGSALQSINELPIAEFARNECYGLSNFGLVYWWLGVTQNAIPTVERRSILEDFVAWHVHHIVFTYAGHVTMRNFVGLNDPAYIKEQTIGFEFRDYVQWKCRIERAEIQGFQWGIILPVNQYPKGKGDLTVPGEFVVSDSVISTWHGLIARIPFHNNSPFGFHPPVNRIVNTRFLPYPWKMVPEATSYYTMAMEWPPRTNADVTLKLTYSFEMYQGEDDSFEVFFPQQSPDAIMLATEVNEKGRTVLLGAPLEGLTNREAWERFGVATGGRLAPCSGDAGYPEIQGLVCHGGGGAPAPGPSPDPTPPLPPSSFRWEGSP